MGFENVILTKIIHIYVIYKAWMHNIHDIKLISSKNVFVSKMQC